MADQKFHIGGHAGFEKQLFIINTHDRVVGNDVLHHDRRVAHLQNLAVKAPRRIGVDGEIHFLIHPHVTDVALADVGVDLHFSQIVGDQEKRRRLE